MADGIGSSILAKVHAQAAGSTGAGTPQPKRKKDNRPTPAPKSAQSIASVVPGSKKDGKENKKDGAAKRKTPRSKGRHAGTAADLPDRAFVQVDKGEGAADPNLMTDLKTFMTGLDFAAVAPGDEGRADQGPQAGSGPSTLARGQGGRTPSVPTTSGKTTSSLDSPQEVARRAKREARAEQRKQQAKKRAEGDNMSKEGPVARREAQTKESRSNTRKEARQKVEEVKGRVVANATARKSTSWIIQPTPVWYQTESFTPLPATSSPITETALDTLTTRSSALLSALNEQYASALSSSGKEGRASDPTGLSESDKAFVNKILASGTSSDRLSALILLVSSAPLHTTSHLTTLLNLCKKKSRDEAGRTARAVVGWLRGADTATGGGLPNRKLRYFRDQPGLSAVAELQKGKSQGKRKGVSGTETLEGDEWLALWAFEDWLKRWYLDLLRVIENLSVDPLAFIRVQSVTHSYHLLRDKPEQEQNLLRLLVNKLGDGEKSVASRASHHCLQILQEHPGMKAIMIREIASLILKPITPEPRGKRKAAGAIGPSPAKHHDHARYYGSITLNQVSLTRGDGEVANKLVEVYFELFGDILGRAAAEEETTEREVMAGDAPSQNDAPNDRRKRKARREKKDPAPRSEEEATDRQAKLVAAILTGLKRAFPYASLDDAVLSAHADVLFRVVHNGAFNVSVQALGLIAHVATAKPEIKERFLRVLYGTLWDPRLLNSSKQAMYLNTLFQAIKNDGDSERAAAFVKRIVQVLPLHQPPFICGALYLLGELFSTVGGLRQMVSAAGVNDQKAYDPRKRDPSFARAGGQPLWELHPLLSHYHPAVALNAAQLQEGKPITSTADLERHTLSHFLDRFVYRNPKKSLTSKGPSMMQPGAAVNNRSGLVLLRKGSNADGVEGGPALNSVEFLDKAADRVPVDQRFFHSYFRQKAEIEQTKLRKKEKHKTTTAGSGSEGPDLSEDEGDVPAGGTDAGESSATFFSDAGSAAESSLDEDEVWRAMRRTMPHEPGDETLLEADEDDEEALAFAPTDFDDLPDGGLHNEGGGASSDMSDDSDPGAFGEGSDAFDSDDEVALDLQGDASEASEDGGDASDSSAPAKGTGKPRARKRQKLSHLPVFASAEDYAALLGDHAPE